MRFLPVLGLLLAATAICAEEPDPDVLRKRAAKVEGQILSELRSINDKATARAAHKGLEADGKERAEIEKAVTAMNAEGRARLEKQLADDLATVRTSQEKEIVRVSLIPEAVAVVDDLPVVQ